MGIEEEDASPDELRDLWGVEDWTAAPEPDLFEVRCLLPQHPEWVVWAVFQNVSDNPELQQVRIRPYQRSAPPGGLTSAVLRDVRLSELYVRAHQLLENDRLAIEYWRRPPIKEYRKRPGRRGRDDLFYARWAGAYVGALGTSPTPVKGLAKQRHLSQSQVRSILHEARRRDLLTASPPGRAGGELTGKARDLLARHKSEGGQA